MLTLEQSALIPIYKEKWKKILISSDIIDRSKAKANTILLYRSIGLSKPQIIFVDTPYIAVDIILKEFWKLVLENHTDKQLHSGIMWEILYEIWGGSVWGRLDRFPRPELSIEGRLEDLSILKRLTSKFSLDTNFQINQYGIYQINTPKSRLNLSEEVFLYFEQLWKEVESKTIRNLVSQAFRQLKALIEQYFPPNQRLSDSDVLGIIDRCLWRMLENHYIRTCHGTWSPSLSIAYGCYYDLCYSVLGVSGLKKDLEILQDFFLNCYWIFPFKDVCLISGRPSKNKLIELGIS